MVSIRKKHLEVFEYMTMFKQQILCHKLPNSFNSIKMCNDEKSHVNGRNKIMQAFKRRMLNIDLGQYEVEIQQ